jgi:hypothetical protein
MVKTFQRRQLVGWMQSCYQLSQRRACSVAVISASSFRYSSVKPDQRPWRLRLRDLASVRLRAGYRQLHVFMRREGWRINHKRVYRIYREEGLCLKRQRRRRHRSAAVRVERPQATGPNQQWAMDFMHDTLADGRSIRVLTVIDLYTRECVALQAAKGFRGADVAQILERSGEQRTGLPQRIRVDNGTVSRRRPWTTGRTGSRCSWTSVGRENRWTTPSSRRSMAASGECASRNTGSKASRRRRGSSISGRRTTTTPGRTAHWVRSRPPSTGAAVASCRASNGSKTRTPCEPELGGAPNGPELPS